MTKVLLIASGAYVEPELEAEFGRIPPAFLPVANRRLFVHQRAAAADAFDSVYLSLPEDFEMDSADAAELATLNITVVPVPTGLTLGNSLVYVINLLALSRSSFSVLHGDTLINSLSGFQEDAVTIAPAPAGYQWGFVREGKGLLESASNTAEKVDSQPHVLSGFFAFQEASLLVQTITRQDGSFLKGITEYTKMRPLRVVRHQDWLDFGHANTFYQSRKSLTTEREFNLLEASRRYITKSSRHNDKISAEADWFENLPSKLRIFAPAYLGRAEQNGRTSYSLEYLSRSTLAELFVFGRLPVRAWERIFDACDEFLGACGQHRPLQGSAVESNLYLAKTLSRLDDYAKVSGISLTEPCRLNGLWLPSIEKMARLAAEMIPTAEPTQVNLVHGDFCFSNILYDFRDEMVRVIDPRGIDSQGRATAYGDMRYDVAKLYHSVVGRYDHILAGRYTLARSGMLDFDFRHHESEHLGCVEKVFLERKFRGWSVHEMEAPAIATLLFLSMLPIHADDPVRQSALLANAMRLFLDLDYEKRKTA